MIKATPISACATCTVQGANKMATPMKKSTDTGVELGFLEDADSWKLTSKYFPSKVGGKPAWLNLRDLPRDAVCGSCGGPLAFLLQIYAPVPTLDECFHRTLFLFYCENPGCCHTNEGSLNFAAFRCQLPRRNEFYSYAPPNEDDNDAAVTPTASEFGPVCVVCGGRGAKRCARCHATNYCSREHQALDWKSGHKRTCTGSGGGGDSVSAAAAAAAAAAVAPINVHLLPECEIVTEPEEVDERREQVEGRTEGEEEKVVEDITRPRPEDVRDLEDMAKSRHDRQFMRFRRRIDLEPEQVLRFHRGGTPLWVSDVGKATDKDVSKCVACGAARQFEFQVLPQLLNHLKLDSTEESVDWGTLAVYTCSRHCGTRGYAREFVWKQDFGTDDGRRSRSPSPAAP